MSSTPLLRPADGDSEMTRNSVLFTITGRGLAWYIIPFPAVGFVLCVLLAIITDFEGTTATHCKVANYLPSISAAIGGGPPMIYVWRICIALHVAPRLMVAIVYYNHYQSFPVVHKRSLYNLLTLTLCLLHILENLSLVLLSYISSKENHAIHENSFIAFMVFSQLYMILSLIVFKWSRSTVVQTESDKSSFRRKCFFAGTNISMFLAAVYVFFRHNWYCEPGAFTVFAAMEYYVIFSNIAFHSTFILDSQEFSLSFHPDRAMLQLSQKRSH